MFNALKGWIGEKKTSLNIWFSLDKATYTCFHNLILPSHNGTTQIDHLIISKYGLFIVETKNIKGWIFGHKDSAKWTLSLYRNKYSFQNPLRQTYRQQKVLSEFLNIDENLIKTVIYFNGKCRLRTPLPSNVIKSGLGRYIKSFRTPKLDLNHEQYVIHLIQAYVSTTALTTHDHVKSLKNRHNSTLHCPHCSSSLVKRVSKSGYYKGSYFLGCSNYPKCRYTKTYK
ncbi:hypothetical protein JCM19233_6117 [Vibrio astriarenae]|nr:hypothetical protein JCM19233_6117 [Vibrio sp. C7]